MIAQPTSRGDGSDSTKTMADWLAEGALSSAAIAGRATTSMSAYTPPCRKSTAYRHMSERCTPVSSASYARRKARSPVARPRAMMSSRQRASSARRTFTPRRVHVRCHSACCAVRLSVGTVWCSTMGQRSSC